MEEQGVVIDFNDEFYKEGIKSIKLRYPNVPYREEQMEQIAYRLYLCSDCIRNRECEHCGCNPYDTIGEYFSCNKGEKFGSFTKKEIWDKYKLNNKITFIK